jgi:hypothetical protein
LKQHSEVPEISLESVMAASGLIEKMGHEQLKSRKDGTQKKVDLTQTDGA